MRRLTLFGLALMAVFASAAALATSALALPLPLILPGSTSGRAWEGVSEGEPELIGPLTVKCTKATATGTQEPGTVALGLFHITFMGCLDTATKKKCMGLSDVNAGEILVLGTWHLVWDRKNGAVFEKLTTATLFLVDTVHFSCGALLLAEVKGEQLCLDLKPDEENKTHSFHCIAEGSKQTEEWCKEDKVDEKEDLCIGATKPLLLTSTNGGGFKESAELALGNWSTTDEAVFTDI